MEFVKFHCFNHNLELVIKYRFTEIQKTLTKLHSFSNSDKSRRMFQIIGESLQLKVLRSTKAHVLYFQLNVEKNLSTFLLFAERSERKTPLTIP